MRHGVVPYVLIMEHRAGWMCWHETWPMRLPPAGLLNHESPMDRAQARGLVEGERPQGLRHEAVAGHTAILEVWELRAGEAKAADGLSLHYA